MESISSMKMMAGAFFSASSNAFLRLLSDSPASFDMISGPLIRKKKAPGKQQALMSGLQATVLRKHGSGSITILSRRQHWRGSH